MKTKHDQLFKKVESLRGDLQRLLKEIDTDLEVDKPKKGDDRKDPAIYDNKRGIVLNLSNITSATKRESKIIIGEAERVIEVYEKAKGLNEFVAKNIVVDLTKVVNELKDLIDKDIDSIEGLKEVQKVFRYTVTAVSNANKKIKELEDKREAYKKKLLDERYLEELAKLKKKYKVDEAELKLKELEQEAGDIQQNASKIEKEAKEIIRSLRNHIKELYDLPDKVIDEIKIYLKTLGEIATISKQKTSAKLTKEGIAKFLSDPEFREYLEGNGWAQIKELSDRVDIMNVEKLPELGTFFSEIKLKSEQIVSDIESEGEKLEDKVEKDDKLKTEGIFTDAFNKFAKNIFGQAKKYFNKLASLYETYSNKFLTLISAEQKEISRINEDHEKLMRELQKDYLGVLKVIKKVEMEFYQEAQDIL